MASIGKTLREERERQGRTLQEVSDAIKIKEAYLQALEEENFDVIPGVVFIKGFIRTYAGYLGLDGKALTEEYKRVYIARTPQPEVRPVTQDQSQKKRQAHQKSRQFQSKWQGITILAGIILFLLLIIWLLL